MFDPTSGNMVRYVDDPRLMFVVFTANGCSFCVDAQKVITRIIGEMGVTKTVTLLPLDIAQHTTIRERLHIREVPHVVMYRQGVAVCELDGPVTDASVRDIIRACMEGSLKRSR
jgi:thioredoxin-like negative regulator of GroEL